MTTRDGPPADGAGTREQILGAAAELFAAQGFPGTSIRQVAERAGANSALIYYYFGSKAELFHEVVREPGRRLTQLLERVLAEPGPPRARLEHFIREYVRFVLGAGPYPSLVFRSLAAGDAELAQVLREHMAPNLERVIRLIQECVEAGECRRVDARLAAGNLIGMIVFYVVAAPVASPVVGLEGDPAGAERLAAHTIELFLEGIAT